MSDEQHPGVPAERGIYCNRTLNLRAIRAVGYDMDYTLIHYRVRKWEQRSYDHLRDKLLAQGWPVEPLTFDPELMVRGLVLDVELGNIVKTNRFGYVKQASHGTQPIPYEQLRAIYARTVVDLDEPRFRFVNTLFSQSEVCMYAQLVDLLDDGVLAGPSFSYGSVHRVVRRALDEAHMEGQLKSEIVADPERFVVLDPETPLALLDQQRAGKKLLLITNSEWPYTRSLMHYAFDRFLPDGMGWRDLFEVVIVGARKPHFFSTRSPLFEVVDDDGLLRPVVGAMRAGGVFLGGNAELLEEHLGLSGDEILYVGDHITSDVHASKAFLRWRTALILRELEAEITAIDAFAPNQRELSRAMARKAQLELAYDRVKLQLQRRRKNSSYGPNVPGCERASHARLKQLRAELEQLDADIAPRACAASELGNHRWGLLLRAGNDKSQLARQVERYADIYSSRVSNFLSYSPFAYLRAPRGSLPHDPTG